MDKSLRLTIVFAFFIIFAVQVGQVLANHKDEDKKPVTGPITSPITSPLICKPGWGFGDKNHCHFGPPGQNKQDNDNKNNKDSDSHNSQGDNHQGNKK